MGQGYTRNDTANNIADGNVIDAVDLDGEFDAIVAAFESATGHTHDGTSAEGAPINQTGPAQEYVSDGTSLSPKTNNTYSLGIASKLWSILYATTALVANLRVSNLKANDGTTAGSIADSTGVVTLASAVLTTADINGGTLDGVTIGATTPAAVTTSSLVATTADINGGTIDAATIGATTPAVGSFTNVNVTGTVDGRDVATDGAKLDTIDQGVATTDSPSFVGLTATGAFTSLGIDDNATATAVTIDSSENVGIGDTSPEAKLHANSGASNLVALFESTDAGASLTLIDDGTTGGSAAEHGLNTVGDELEIRAVGSLSFEVGGVEYVTVEASGNILLGPNVPDSFPANNTSGKGAAWSESSGVFGVLNEDGPSGSFGRWGTEGEVVRIYHGGSLRGTIGAGSSDLVIDGGSGHSGIRFAGNSLVPRDSGSDVNDLIDLGTSTYRFDDIYATNGTINTSDENEKQEIAKLSPELMKVAARISKEFVGFKWNDAVDEKGKQARIHFGTIAQRVEDAFYAEGLNPWDYGVLTMGSWMESVDSEGVVARYDTEDEDVAIPEGAELRVLLGVRYTELQSFIAAYNEQRFNSLEERITALENK